MRAAAAVVIVVVVAAAAAADAAAATPPRNEELESRRARRGAPGGVSARSERPRAVTTHALTAICRYSHEVEVERAEAAAESAVEWAEALPLGSRHRVRRFHTLRSDPRADDGEAMAPRLNNFALDASTEAERREGNEYAEAWRSSGSLALPLPPARRAKFLFGDAAAPVAVGSHPAQSYEPSC